METCRLRNILDPRRLPLHLMVVFISLIVVAISFLSNSGSIVFKDLIHLFFLMLIQIELFVILGIRIFKRFELGSTRKELTRSVLFRFSIFFVVCISVSLLILMLFKYSICITKGCDWFKLMNDFVKFELKGWFTSTSTGLLFGAIIFIFILWQDALQREYKLREENLIFQNETLKYQVNPHFLFNNLNTLSSLINTHPELAEEFINRLSSIYRYILENSSKEKVPLKAELSFIKDYYYLHKIRGEGKIQLAILVNEPENLEILPTSLQGLVENAIKHNKATKEFPLRIDVYREGQHVVVKNNLQKMVMQIKSTGIGLKNLSQRIQLMSGKNIEIEETNDYFLVKLPLLS